MCRKLCRLVGAAMVALAIAPAGALAGPVILGGDDLHDHGSVDGSGNPQGGWIYITKAIGNLSPNVTRANDNSIAAIGSAASSDTSSNGGAAIGVAANKNGLPVTYYDDAPAIEAFFAGLANGTIKPKIIWLSGSGVTNSYDESGGCGGTEDQVVTAHAKDIDRFVSQGGGLMSHGTCYGFLSALLPGLKTVEDGGDGDLVLTPDGQSAFPGLTDADVNSGPWHNHFEGNLGGLRVLVESTGVKTSSGANAPVIIGGSAVSITPSADVSITKSDKPDPATVGRDLVYTLNVRNNGPGQATGVSVSDTLPGGLKAKSKKTTAGSCSGSTTVTCNIGTLANGAKARVTITVRPNKAGDLDNSASVSTTSSDSNTANNTATARTHVRSAPRLQFQLPRRCVSTSFTSTIRVTGSTPQRTVQVFLDGKRIANSTANVVRVTIPAGSLQAGKHRVRATARNSDGATASLTQTFQRCAQQSREDDGEGGDDRRGDR